MSYLQYDIDRPRFGIYVPRTGHSAKLGLLAWDTQIAITVDDAPHLYPFKSRKGSWLNPYNGISITSTEDEKSHKRSCSIRVPNSDP